MNLSKIDIAWIAGILEGEGCFMIYTRESKFNNRWKPSSSPIVCLRMTDTDVVDRVGMLLGKEADRYSHYHNISRGYKKAYRLRLVGPKAIGLMMTIYSFMGIRRRAKIKEIITEWKNGFPISKSKVA